VSGWHREIGSGLRQIKRAHRGVAYGARDSHPFDLRAIEHDEPQSFCG